MILHPHTDINFCWIIPVLFCDLQNQYQALN